MVSKWCLVEIILKKPWFNCIFLLLTGYYKDFVKNCVLSCQSFASDDNQCIVFKITLIYDLRDWADALCSHQIAHPQKANIKV